MMTVKTTHRWMVLSYFGVTVISTGESLELSLSRVTVPVALTWQRSFENQSSLPMPLLRGSACLCVLSKASYSKESAEEIAAKGICQTC